MYRTLYEKSSGTIVSCVNLSPNQLVEYLQRNPEHDYVDMYTKGVKNVAIDTVTKKLKKIAPVQIDPVDVIRQTRLKLLAACDWTQSLDSPLSESKRAEWATYRQALRDMTDTFANVNNVSDIVWPTPPQ